MVLVIIIIIIIKQCYCEEKLHSGYSQDLKGQLSEIKRFFKENRIKQITNPSTLDLYFNVCEIINIISAGTASSAIFALQSLTYAIQSALVVRPHPFTNRTSKSHKPPSKCFFRFHFVIVFTHYQVVFFLLIRPLQVLFALDFTQIFVTLFFWSECFGKLPTIYDFSVRIRARFEVEVSSPNEDMCGTSQKVNVTRLIIALLKK